MILSFRKLIKSFRNAFRGLKLAGRENSFRFLLLITVLVLAFTVYLPLEKWEVLLILFLIGSVVVAEVINSQIERILDVLEPSYDERIRNIKDISAAGVLIMAFISLIIGLSIFIPHILKVLNI